MKAYILNIGDEVLSGKVINTNASYLASELEVLGIKVSKTIVVGDEANDISTALLEFINSDANLLISTGGLGPTHDDLTKEVICRVLGLELVYNTVASQDMFNYFQQVKNDCNLKQAYYPQDSIIISNEIGSADGVIIPYNDKIIILLVGPFLEMKHLYTKSVINYLSPYIEKKLFKDYMVMGESESFFENLLDNLIKNPFVKIAPYASLGLIRYRIISSNEKIFKQVNQEFCSIMKDYIISDQGELIEEVLVKLLIEKKEKISCAESMTGGLIAKKITSVPRASEVFSRSFVVYDQLAKKDILGLDEVFFQNHDAVSEECVIEMLKGLKNISTSDLLMVISGYAGPEGKEVGLVWGAFFYKGLSFTKKFIFRGNREMIREKAGNYFLYHAYKLIKEGKI